MVKALDDILIGFLIFFALDRGIRLFSNGVVEPWAETRSSNKNVIENWKLGVEFLMLLLALGIVMNNRNLILKLNKT